MDFTKDQHKYIEEQEKILKMYNALDKVPENLSNEELYKIYKIYINISKIYMLTDFNKYVKYLDFAVKMFCSKLYKDNFIDYGHTKSIYRSLGELFTDGYLNFQKIREIAGKRDIPKNVNGAIFLFIKTLEKDKKDIESLKNLTLLMDNRFMEAVCNMSMADLIINSSSVYRDFIYLEDKSLLNDYFKNSFFKSVEEFEVLIIRNYRRLLNLLYVNVMNLSNDEKSVSIGKNKTISQTDYMEVEIRYIKFEIARYLVHYNYLLFLGLNVKDKYFDEDVVGGAITHVLNYYKLPYPMGLTDNDLSILANKTIGVMPSYDIYYLIAKFLEITNYKEDNEKISKMFPGCIADYYSLTFKLIELYNKKKSNEEYNINLINMATERFMFYCINTDKVKEINDLAADSKLFNETKENHKNMFSLYYYIKKHPEYSDYLIQQTQETIRYYKDNLEGKYSHRNLYVDLLSSWLYYLYCISKKLNNKINKEIRSDKSRPWQSQADVIASVFS